MKKLLLILAFVLVPCVVFAKSYGKPDALQLQLVQQLTELHNNLIDLYTDQLQYYHRVNYQDEMEYRASQHRGTIPRHLRRERDKLERAGYEIQSKITELEKKQEELKFNTFQIYKGKMPKWLGNAWVIETTRYIAEWKEKIEPEMNEIRSRRQ